MSYFKYEYVAPEDLKKTLVRQLLSEGEGEFVVIKAEDADVNGYPLKSKAGSFMLKLTLKVKDSKNLTSLIDDYLVASVAFKIKEFADAVGLPGMYNASATIETAKLVGLKGACIIRNETYTGRDGVPRESSKIATYLVGGVINVVPDEPIPF